MKNQDYHSIITTHGTLEEAFAKISRISEWWAKDFEGKSEEPNDVFTVRFKNGDMYKVKVAEMTSNKKIIWEVIDSYQGWHNDHTEWVGTKIVWEVFPKTDSIEVKMTHLGLVPEFECFDKCSLGWDYLMEKSLLNFLNSDKGMPA
jgi:hypothetical protein